MQKTCVQVASGIRSLEAERYSLESNALKDDLKAARSTHLANGAAELVRLYYFQKLFGEARKYAHIGLAMNPAKRDTLRLLSKIEALSEVRRVMNR